MIIISFARLLWISLSVGKDHRKEDRETREKREEAEREGEREGEKGRREITRHALEGGEGDAPIRIFLRIFHPHRVHHLAKTLVSLADSASQTFCVHGSSTRAGCYCGKRLCRERVCLRVGVGVGVGVCASILLMTGLASTAAYRAFLDKLEICIECVDLVYTDPAGTLGVHIQLGLFRV